MEKKTHLMGVLQIAVTLIFFCRSVFENCNKVLENCNKEKVRSISKDPMTSYHAWLHVITYFELQTAPHFCFIAMRVMSIE